MSGKGFFEIEEFGNLGISFVSCSSQQNDFEGAGLVPVDDGHVWLSSRLRESLEQAGLAHFDQVMATDDGHCMRALRDRENWRLSLDMAHGTPQCIYLKKHHVRTLTSRLRARLRLDPGETPAQVEARNVGRLMRDGIDTMRLVAYGQKLHEDGRLESFLLTEELAGYKQLDHFLAERFGRRELFLTKQRDEDDQALRTLIGQVADTARRFHEAGYNHRDLYCCHFFIRELLPGHFDICLIDLQRVQHRRRNRRRWIVKDLAQLAYSAPRDRIKCTQKMAFIRRYLGVKKLRSCDKRLIREVLAKQQLMEQKQGIIP